jgi:hypothetical protein
VAAQTVGEEMATAEREPGSIEAMEHVLSYLMWERQQLRSHGVNGAELEANEKAIAAMQWHIAQARQGDQTASC